MKFNTGLDGPDITKSNASTATDTPMTSHHRNVTSKVLTLVCNPDGIQPWLMQSAETLNWAARLMIYAWAKTGCHEFCTEIHILPFYLSSLHSQLRTYFYDSLIPWDIDYSPCPWDLQSFRITLWHIFPSHGSSDLWINFGLRDSSTFVFAKWLVTRAVRCRHFPKFMATEWDR